MLWFSMETSLAVVVGWEAAEEEAMVSVSRGLKGWDNLEEVYVVVMLEVVFIPLHNHSFA